MTGLPKWGVCATVKADTHDILRFAAYHLDAGAHRIWICLDVPNPSAREQLKAHPKCRAILCDDTYWQRQNGKRPIKHQVRQSLNATRTLRRAADVDWLLHIDVDEFVVADSPVDRILSKVPAQAMTARLRPMEALATSDGSFPTAFKAFIPPGADRNRVVSGLYPEAAGALKGGFLSHVAGKVFVRTGVTDMTLRIHNAFLGDQMNPGEAELNEINLAHVHTRSWDDWRSHFDYRIDRGAYRADLAPARPEAKGGQTLHAFFTGLLATDGDAGLRRFFDTVCVDTPELRARLQREGLLQLQDLQLEAKLHQQFPESA